MRVSAKKIALFSALVVLVVGVGSGVALIQRYQTNRSDAAQSVNIACPLTTSNGIIVNFEPDILRTERTLADSQGTPITTNIPAGQYKVTLVSYEIDHPQHLHQPDERYFVRLMNSQGVVVAETNAIDDLPDDETVKQQVVNTSLNLTSNIVTVQPIHPGFQDFSSPNSINAVCALFEPLSTPTATATPTSSPTQVPTATPTATPTHSPMVPMSVNTPTPTPTQSPSPTPLVTATPTATATPSTTPAGTNTPAPTSTPSSTDSGSPLALASASPTPPARLMDSGNEVPTIVLSFAALAILFVGIKLLKS